MTDVPAFNEVFAQLATSEGLAPRTVEQVFGAILAGAWTPAQIAGLLIGMRLRGETAPQIAAAARAMRAAMVPVEHGFDRTLDTCGTGGDGQGTVNISTGAAIIAAACGIPVAKHGNRAVSSQSGRADILQTIFNILGPLSNPARVTHQLLGAFDDALRPVLAKTLDELGVQRAWVVRGADGLDEISPYGPTLVSELAGGTIRELSVSPSDFGVETSPAGAARGGDAEANAQILLRVLAGEDHPARSAFVLNAAAAIAVADGDSLPDAARRADEALRSGAARSRLDAWRSAALAAREA
jgi:anthranilate phosphoribosyltransferase